MALSRMYATKHKTMADNVDCKGEEGYNFPEGITNGYEFNKRYGTPLTYSEGSMQDLTYNWCLKIMYITHGRHLV